MHNCHNIAKAGWLTGLTGTKKQSKMPISIEWFKKLKVIQVISSLKKLVTQVTIKSLFRGVITFIVEYHVRATSPLTYTSNVEINIFRKTPYFVKLCIRIHTKIAKIIIENFYSYQSWLKKFRTATIFQLWYLLYIGENIKWNSCI